MLATIYCLLFGDYFKLHKRLLDSLQKHLPPGEARVVIWCNTVCADTQRYLQYTPGSWEIILSTENVPKYEVMRRLFRGTAVPAPETEWIVWLDDDSHIVKADWWEKTKAYLAEKEAEGVVYVGQPWYVHHLPGQWEFIKQAVWFKGLEPQMCPTRKPGVKQPGIWFAQGAYWLLRTDVMERLNWPDDRLIHNGGDTLLGEAVRQQGLPFHRFSHGVAINDGKRRGRSERPAGSRVNVHR